MSEEPSLEKLMEIMAEDPARSEEFWARLLSGQVFLLSDGIGQHGERIAKEGETLKIINLATPDGVPFIPLFTSLEKLQRAIKQEAEYIALNGREVLDMTRGANIGLNPADEYGFLLAAEEIGRILDYFGAEPMTVEKETEVLLGEPAEQPVKMKEIIVDIFKNDPRVQSAYFAMMMNKASNQQSFLIGVVFKPGLDNKSVFDRAGAGAKKHIPKGYHLDFVVIDSDKPDGVSDYLLKSGEPIYKAAANA